jgi:hypothetical protein
MLPPCPESGMPTVPTPDWERRSPEAAGLDPDAVAAAVDYHKTHETPHTQVAYDFSTSERGLRQREGEHGTVLGPIRPPGRAERAGPEGRLGRGRVRRHDAPRRVGQSRSSVGISTTAF